jgi:uncharacterized protein YjbI with pentapeptide repeats
MHQSKPGIKHLITAIATFPGEWLEDTLPSLQFSLWKDSKDTPWRLASLHELLVAGEVDFAARKPKSLWSNRLVLPGFDVIDHAKFDSEAKIEALPETASFRARHLEGAVLIGATLRKVDFTGAQLQGAQLGFSDVRDTEFGCTIIFSVPRPCAQLQGALLNWAQLQGARLEEAHLQGAVLSYAHLQGAVLSYAQLQGASLNFAQLQGAWLERAQLQGASLDEADLQGASLDYAQLQGASLNFAQLHGATLEEAQLGGAWLKGVFAWRADVRKTHWEDTRVVNPETGLKYACWKSGERLTCDWSPESFNELKDMIAEQIPEGYRRREAVKRVGQSLDPSKPLDGENEMAKIWEAQARFSLAIEAYEKRVAGIWRETGCAAEGAPYVLRQLLSSLDSTPFDAQSPQKPVLAAAFLDEEQCPCARGLTNGEKAKLKEIRDRLPPLASKQ